MKNWKRGIKRITATAVAIMMIGAAVDWSALTVHAATVGAFTVTGGTNGTDYSYADGVLTVKTDTPLTISNQGSTTDVILVEKDKAANITLAGVTIDVGMIENACAFKIADDTTGKVTITLADNSVNTLKSGSLCAGLQKNGGTGVLEITGTGKLIAQGGAGGAGIGGGYDMPGTYISITGGVIEASGGEHGAGIGGGRDDGDVFGDYSTYGRYITISGGEVKATGNGNAAGIGGGFNSSGRDIDITGGVVEAEGGYAGSGIGGGYRGHGVDISISGGKVTATGNGSGAGIGGGYMCTATRINISGGVVKATATSHGAGIGGGDQGAGNDIKITGGVVTAIGGTYGAGIGGGNFKGASGIKITGGSVKASGGSHGIGGGNSQGEVTPTLEDGTTPVYLFTLENPDSEAVSINNAVYPANHAALDKEDTTFYAYLPAVTAPNAYNVKVGDDTSLYYYYLDWVPIHSIAMGNFTVTGGTSGIDYSYGERALTIMTDTPMTITNADPSADTTDTIVVQKDKNADITLNGVRIDVSKEEDFCAFKIEDRSAGTVKVTLAGGSVNTLKSGRCCAGIQKNEGEGTLIIDGTGTLEVTGGDRSAGIGSGKADVLHGIYWEARNIIINGGTIIAKGGLQGAGIGGGDGEPGSNITINAGVVTAESGQYGAGIGGGNCQAGSNIVITGGSVKAIGNDANAFGGGDQMGAVMPTLADKTTPLYLLELVVDGESNITIDGKPYPQKHYTEDKLYVYLTGADHTVKVGNAEIKYEWDEENTRFIPALNVSCFTYTQPTGLVYTGNAAAIPNTIVTGSVPGIGAITVKYSDEQGNPVAAPTNAGTYKVKIDVAAGTVFGAQSDLTMDDWTFEIAKATPGAGLLNYAAPADPAYNGTVKEAVITPKAGVTGMGEITVKYYRNDTEVIPLNSGIYTVKVDVTEGDNCVAASGITMGEFEITNDAGAVEIPTATFITYGQMLSEAELTDGWQWEGDRETIPAITNSGYVAVKNVDDYDVVDYTNLGGGFTYDEGTHTLKYTVPVTVNKATPDVLALHITPQHEIYGKGRSVRVLADIKNPYTEDSLEDISYTFTIGEGEPIPVTENVFTIPKNTPVGTTITITASRAEDESYFEAATTGTITTVACEHTYADGECYCGIYSGMCGADGDNLKWENIDGTLTISGTGAMADDYAWDSYETGNITVIDIREGVTSIGSAFADCSEVTSVTVPKSVTAVGENAFAGIKNGATVKVPCSWDAQLLYTFDTNAVSLVVPEHTPVYEASANVIAEKCDVCGHTTGTLTVEASSVIYNGLAQGAAVRKEGTLANQNVTVIYYMGDALVGTEAPVNAAAYTAKITYEGQTAETGYTIAAANAAITTHPVANTLAYTGAAQTLIDTSEVAVTGGEMHYSLDGVHFGADVPEGTEADNYKVWYKVAGDANHEDTLPESMDVTIDRKALTITAVTVRERAYDGTNKVEITDASFAGLMNEDDVRIGRAQAVLAEADGTEVNGYAGTPYGYVNLSGITLAGAAASNYEVNPSAERVALAPNVTIGQAVAPALNNVSKIYVYTQSKTGERVTIEGIPADSGTVSYAFAETDAHGILENVSVDDGIVSYDVKALDSYSENVTATVTVTVQMQNYADASFILTVSETDKLVQEISARDLALTYGDTDAAISVAGAMTALSYEVTEDSNSEGDVITVDENGMVSIVNAGTANVRIVAAASDTYVSAECELTVTVSKCSVAVPAKDSTAYTYTGEGQTYQLADSPFYTIENSTHTDAGIYTVSVTLNSDNYEWAGELPVYEFEIRPAAVTITANSYTVKEREELPDFGYTVSGLMNAEALPIAVGVSCETTNSQIIGNYDILVSGPAEEGNYTYTYEKGVLEITHGDAKLQNEKEATCTAGGYTGDKHCSVCGAKLESGSATEALGHNYVSKVTKEPTTEEEGVMTYTCSHCNDVYTRPISKLEDDSEDDTGNVPVVQMPIAQLPIQHPAVQQAQQPEQQPEQQPAENTPAAGQAQETKLPEPFLKGEDGKEGWEVIADEVKATKAGAAVTVDMNGTTVVPGKVFDDIKGQDITMVFELGDGIAWSVNGKAVTSDNVGDIDLEVKTGTAAGDIIPAKVRNTVTGDNRFVNLSLAYEGEFGFEAVLRVNLEKVNAGLVANLFYYNPQTNEMEFVCADEIAEDGTAELRFTHASEYTIVISEAAGQEDDNSVWWIFALVALAAAAGVVGLVAYAKKKSE